MTTTVPIAMLSVNARTFPVNTFIEVPQDREYVLGYFAPWEYHVVGVEATMLAEDLKLQVRINGTPVTFSGPVTLLTIDDSGTTSGLATEDNLVTIGDTLSIVLSDVATTPDADGLSLTIICRLR